MNDPRPYVQMANILRTEIESGTLVSGDIVTINWMMSRFNHSRPTCAHALKVLVSERLVFRYHGFGYKVTTPEEKALIMSANQIVTIKLDLHDANAIAKAIKLRMEDLKNRIKNIFIEPDDTPEVVEDKNLEATRLGSEMIDLERIARLNFPE